MGVLLFFFISGYGVYKGYADKKPSIEFLKKRIINVLIPYLIMKISFILIDILINTKVFSLKNVILSCISDWFIDVILIQYIVFYVSWKISNIKKSNKCLFFICNFSLSIVVAVIFWRLGFIARWYNGLLLFPIGMLVAYYEEKLINLWNKKWFINFFINVVFFLVLGIIFTINKGSLWADFLKTIAGVFLSLFICQFFMKYKLNSKIMQSIGRNSLYYYIIHLSIMGIFSDIEIINSVDKFYLILILTFLIVKIFTLIYSSIKKEIVNHE